MRLRDLEFSLPSAGTDRQILREQEQVSDLKMSTEPPNYRFAFLSLEVPGQSGRLKMVGIALQSPLRSCLFTVEERANKKSLYVLRE